MKAFMVAAVLLATAACGAYQFPGQAPSPSPSPSPATGVVSGRVLAVPCAPIEPAGNVCAGRPVPNLELDYIGSDPTLRKAITDSSGNYWIELPAGSYVVKLKTYMRVLSGPLNVTVTAGSSTVANYLLDSGIRAPAPQQ